jgi:hypothetical protein
MNKLTSGGKTREQSIEVVKFIEHFYKKHGRFPSKNEIYARALGYKR